MIPSNKSHSMLFTCLKRRGISRIMPVHGADKMSMLYNESYMHFNSTREEHIHVCSVYQ
jgi:hypothetical protein